jgi:hypothetical protein
MRLEGLGGFVARTLLWLPVCFAAWYLSAPYAGMLVGSLARMAIAAFSPALIGPIERTGSDLVFVTGLELRAPGGAIGEVLVEVNPLIYTFGLAFFAALMLASRAKPWKIALGAVALLPFQAAGVAFDILVQLAVKLGPDVAAQAAFAGWQREAIALGYQVGALIFPTLVPVILWALLDRSFMPGGSPGPPIRNPRRP